MAAAQAVLVDLPEEVHGPRVTLRPYREEDAPRLWEAIEESRASLNAWMPWTKDYRAPEDAIAAVRHLRARWLLREDLAVGIFVRGSGAYLGGSGLHRIDWGIRRFEIGYWLRDSAVGHGYVSETVQVLTRLAFDRLEANRIEIRMGIANARSRAVPVRLGFAFEGCLRQSMPDVNGRPCDMDQFALIRADYARLPWCTNGSSAHPNSAGSS